MPVHPWRVSVAVTPDALRLVYAIEKDPAVLGGNLEREVLDQDDVLHVAGFGFDGLRGMSPLRHSLRMAGSVALATQEYSARFFANSARPDYVLQTAGKVAPETIEQIKAQIDQRHGSPINAHRPMVLTGGMEAKVLSLPLEDLQLLQIRQFQIEEIARIYGVPPFMIGHTEKTTSWGSGVEGMGKGFVRYTLRGHLNKFQNELNRKFFRTAARVAEFDTTELERGDTKGLFEAFRIAVGRAGEPGFMTVQEVRERLNLKRTPDGDLNPGGTNAEQPAPPAGQ
jgi:HK97 family phage portal protein